jgi:hypothetical protein
VYERSPERLLDLLTTYRYLIGSETGLQRGLERVLTDHAIEFVREHNLGADYGRIDFYLPQDKYGIELKVKGSRSEVLRQLHRYAQSPDISALILITGRARLAFAPITICDKPVLAASLWEGQF